MGVVGRVHNRPHPSQYLSSITIRISSAVKEGKAVCVPVLRAILMIPVFVFIRLINSTTKNILSS